MPLGSPASVQEKIDFVSTLGGALHRYGTPAHRLEAALMTVSESLGLKAQILSMPTAVLASFRIDDHEESRLLRIGPGETNLEKLSQLDAVGDRVLGGHLSVREGLQEIDLIRKRPLLYSPFFRAVCYGVNAGSIALFLTGRRTEVVASLIIGATLGFIDLIPGVAYRRIHEAIAAFVATLMALGCAHLFDPTLSVQSTTLASLLIFLPGLSFTVGMAELATQNLVAGTARLTGAGMVLLKVIFGVVLASQIFEWGFGALPAESPLPIIQPSGFKDLAGVGIVTGALGVLFNVKISDWGWILLAVALSFYSTQMGGRHFGPELGVFLGGFCIGACSNAVARWKNRPATLLTVPGILLLVPGSLGYKSLTFFTEQNVVSGLQAAFQMIFIAAAIVAGLFFGNSLITPKRNL